MQNFIAQSMRRMGLAPSNKVAPTSPNAAGAGVGGKAPLAHMEVSSKWSYSSLEYPMDIQTRTDMGHYMMFYVNVADNTSYSRYNSTEKANKTGVGRGGSGGNSKGIEIGQKQTASQYAILVVFLLLIIQH